MSATEFALYTFGPSSAAYRARIALNLKGLSPEYRSIHLVKDGGAQHSASYKQVNPQGLIPTLLHEGHAIGQSLAIIEFLDEKFPAPPLLPRDPYGRARVRQLAYMVACDIHPINNLRVRQYLTATLKADQAQSDAWYAHWITLGFAAMEAMVSGAAETGKFLHGDAPTLADICLVPQMANARRFKVPVDAFPALVRIDEAARALPAFAKAAPENQQD